jgi:dimeric dUTPase (all-alpha-NTP-PPase superfamily)
MFTQNQITVMVRMQDELNSKINPNWIKDHTQDFLLAAGMETAEAIEHLNYKWWKQQTPDIPQVEMELVDILHFILSDLIRGNRTAYLKVLPAVTVLGKLDLLKSLAATCFADESWEDPIRTLKQCFSAFDMPADKVFSMYVGKNVLNTFRQNNGYKDGTYIKVWSGREDNEYLTDILKTINLESPTIDNDLYEALTAAYHLHA